MIIVLSFIPSHDGFIIIIIIIITRPKPGFGRLGLGGSSGVKTLGEGKISKNVTDRHTHIQSYTPPLYIYHQNLWFADILTAVIDGGQDDRDHWSLTRLRWAALGLVNTVTILIMSDFERMKMTGNQMKILLESNITNFWSCPKKSWFYNIYVTLTTFEGLGWELISRWSRYKKTLIVDQSREINYSLHH